MVVLIPAAGMGTRLGLDQPKAFVALAGRTLLERSVSAAADSGVVDQVVVIVPADQVDATRELLPSTTVVAGGAERSDSVRAGLVVADSDAELVLVHDAARALTPPALFVAVVQALRDGAQAVVPGLPVADTLKRVDDAEQVRATPDRSELRAVQTPQGFAAELLRRAHAGAGDATDDAALVESLGATVTVIPGDRTAFKVTDPFDLRIAQLLCQEGVQ